MGGGDSSNGDGNGMTTMIDWKLKIEICILHGSERSKSQEREIPSQSQRDSERDWHVKARGIT